MIAFNNIFRQICRDIYLVINGYIYCVCSKLQPNNNVRIISFIHNPFYPCNLFCTYNYIANILLFFSFVILFFSRFTICCLVMKKGEYTKCNLNMQWDLHRQRSKWEKSYCKIALLYCYWTKQINACSKRHVAFAFLL